MKAFLVDFSNESKPIAYYGEDSDLATKIKDYPELETDYQILADDGSSDSIFAHSLINMNSRTHKYVAAGKKIVPIPPTDIKDRKINRALNSSGIKSLLEELEILHPGITQNVRSRMQQGL